MSSAWYALRRTVPPWSAEDGLIELIGFCRLSRIDEVIVMVDTEEFSHGLPPMDWIDKYMPILQRIKSELNSIGVAFSINPWVTLGHCDRGRHVKLTYPEADLMVGHDGTECTACACPLSEGWRDIMRQLWHRYASTEPEVIWVEDDFRLLNHSPVQYGCFCPHHLRAFGERIGQDINRQELVAALLAPGEPHPYRAEWLNMNRGIMVETARFLERTVHEVSPRTRLGLMCSAPTSHAIEGRDWSALTSALAGDQILVARPCMSNYSEHSLRDLYMSGSLLRCTMHCLGPGKIIQTEVENVPFTGYSKSARFTFLQCALSFVFGADGVTLNLFDHVGTPMSLTPEYGAMLSEKKPYLNALADCCKGGEIVGVRILHEQNGSYHVRLPENACFHELSAEGHAWQSILESLGFSTTFDGGGVIALSGQVARSLEEDQIREMLSGSVLVDLTALKCLLEMGYGELLGVSISGITCKWDEPLAAEEYFNAEFGGSASTFLTHSIPHLGGDPEVVHLDLADGAIVVSRLVDPDRNPRHPFVTLYENNLGGRVAIYPVDMDHMLRGVSFLHPYRKRQLSAVLGWLTTDSLPLVVHGGPYPLPFRLDFNDRIVVGAFNLTLDSWPCVTFDVRGRHKLPVRVERLDDGGTWCREQMASVLEITNGFRVDLQRQIEPASPVVLSIPLEQD